MTTIRRLTPTQGDRRGYYKISDQRQRAELLSHVMARAIRQFMPDQGRPETDEEMSARLSAEVDRMGMRWRVFSDMEMRMGQREPETEYDAAAAAYGERR